MKPGSWLMRGTKRSCTRCRNSSRVPGRRMYFRMALYIAVSFLSEEPCLVPLEHQTQPGRRSFRVGLMLHLEGVSPKGKGNPFSQGSIASELHKAITWYRFMITKLARLLSELEGISWLGGPCYELGSAM